MTLIIASVEATALAATWDRADGGWDTVPPSPLPPASSHRTLPRRGQFTTLVRIRTRDGREGIGEAYGLPAPEVPATIIGRILAPLLIGQDAMATEALWETVYGAQKGAGRTGGFCLEATSGVDMALWDLRGKALGQPIHRLLGGPVRDRVPCYASPVPFLPDPEASARSSPSVSRSARRATTARRVLRAGEPCPGLRTDAVAATSISAPCVASSASGT